MPADTLETEKALADAWGLTMKDLAEVRRARLRKDYHWLLDNSTVMYTPQGIAALRERVTPRARPEENAGEVPLPQVGLLTVLRVPANPRMVIAVDADGLHYRIKVQSNRNFKKGMRLELPPDCLRDPLGLYHLKKLPRFYGRW